MQRRRLLIMRHGAVDYFAPRVTREDGRKDVPLTALGRAQAAAAGAFVQAERPDRAFTSNLLRAEETARRALEAAGAGQTPVEALEGLRELAAPPFTDIAPNREAFARLFAATLADAGRPGARFLGRGEPFEEAYARVSDVLHGLLARRDWRTALIVAHEGVNRLALAWACGAGPAAAAAIEQDFARLSVVDVDIAPGRETGGVKVLSKRVKLMNAAPAETVAAPLDRRTSIETLFAMEAGALLMDAAR